MRRRDYENKCEYAVKNKIASDSVKCQAFEAGKIATDTDTSDDPATDTFARASYRYKIHNCLAALCRQTCSAERVNDSGRSEQNELREQSAESKPERESERSISMCAWERHQHMQRNDRKSKMCEQMARYKSRQQNRERKTIREWESGSCQCVGERVKCSCVRKTFPLQPNREREWVCERQRSLQSAQLPAKKYLYLSDAASPRDLFRNCGLRQRLKPVYAKLFTEITRLKKTKRTKILFIIFPFYCK